MAVLARILMLSLGGVLGVNARYWLGVWMNRWAPAPWATFTINISGAFAIGVLTVGLAHWLPHPNARLLVTTGFLGGYTTFSTLAFESAVLWERGNPALAIANLLGSVTAGLFAALLGMIVAREMIAVNTEPPPVSEPRVQVTRPLPTANPGPGPDLVMEEEGRSRRTP